MSFADKLHAMTLGKTQALQNPRPDPPRGQMSRKEAREYRSTLKQGEPDWSRGCYVCGEKPTVFAQEKDASPLCGPCTFGEAETSGGNW